jgi:hypothetical protein
MYVPPCCIHVVGWESSLFHTIFDKETSFPAANLDTSLGWFSDSEKESLKKMQKRFNIKISVFKMIDFESSRMRIGHENRG